MSTEPAIGHISDTGAVYIGDDTYVADWVVRKAPFGARPARGAWAVNGAWVVTYNNDHMCNYGFTEAEARQKADELNQLAAAAVMVMP